MGCDISVSNLRKTYRDGREALKGVSFNIDKGVVASLMGPNGSGKTTTLQILAGVLRPSSGDVTVCGYDVWGSGWEAARRLIGFSPQDPPFPPRLTSMEALIVLSSLLGLEPGYVKRKARMLLDELGFGGIEGVRVARLSGGQRKALSIVLALLGEPEVVILDEPASGLDPNARARLWSSVSKLLKGTTVVFSTHDPSEAEEASTLTIIMHRGSVAAMGSPGDLIKRYAPKPRVRVWASSHPESLKPRRTTPGFAEFIVDSERGVVDVVSEYASSGIHVDKVELARPSLREVYFEVTGEDIE